MFFDSSVRSTRTIALRPPSCSQQRRPPRLHVVLSRPLQQARQVDAQRMEAQLGRPPVVRHRQPVIGGRAEHVDAALRERLRPPARVEARGVCPEHAEQGLAGDVGRQQAEVVGRCPRRVREVRDAHVRPQVAQHPRDQRQVVVLHEHPRVGCGILGECLGERAVVGLVRRPLAAEVRRRRRASSGCRRACGARTTASSWRRRCRRGGRSSGRWRASAPRRRRCRARPCPAGHPRRGSPRPGRRRRAPHTPRPPRRRRACSSGR